MLDYVNIHNNISVHAFYVEGADVTMLETIILTVAAAIIENSFVKGIEVVSSNRKRKAYENEIKKLCRNKLNAYADTTLDSGAFHNYIASKKFKNFLCKFFTVSYDGKCASSLIESFVDDAHKNAPSCDRIQIRQFFSSIDVLYTEYLHKILNENPSLSALWGLISRNNRMVYKKVYESEENQKRYMDALFTPKQLGARTDLKSYHNSCINEYSKISFTGISGAEMKAPKNENISLYVENHFQIAPEYLMTSYAQSHARKSSDDLRRADLSNFYLKNIGEIFNLSNRIVLVGGAGYGKTTNVNYLFCKYKELFNQDILRIKINLKDYSGQFESGKHVFDFLADEVRKKTPRSKQNNIDTTISEYLDSGSALIIFDALDEITSESVREKARQEISHFVDMYYLNKFIITTREVGYLQHRFDESFLHIRICPFNPEQIKQYANAWYTLINLEVAKKRGFKTKLKTFYLNFKQEVKRAGCHELISNPIILVLALIIFYNEENLPHKRVKFYEKCIDTFLNTRERLRGTFQDLDKIENILCDDSILPKIAYYRHKELETIKNYSFTKQEIKKFIFKAIDVQDTRNWVKVVDLFTKYIVERTELISEVDKDIYDFTHKTFGEYFLACYFAKNLEPADLAEHIKKWLGDSNKDEAAKLIIEVVIERNQAQHHEAVMNMLIDTVEELHTQEDVEFDMFNKSEVRSQATHFLSILSDLSASGMLTAKFSDKLYNLLTKYPNLIHHSSFHDILHYDTTRLINFSAEKYKNDKDIVTVINRFYNISELFFVFLPDDEESMRMTKHFIDTHKINTKTSQILNAILLSHDYMETIPIEVDFRKLIQSFKKDSRLFNSPEAFNAVICRLCCDTLNSIYVSAAFITSFNIIENTTLADFINSDGLSTLVVNLLTDSKWFALNILALSKSAKPSVTFFLNHRLRICAVMELEKYDDKSVANSMYNKVEHNRLLLQSLFNCNTYEEFLQQVKENNVYDSVYDTLYKDCYTYASKKLAQQKLIKEQHEKLRPF